MYYTEKNVDRGLPLCPVIKLGAANRQASEIRVGEPAGW